jgi:type I restriction enzyme M protein
MTDSTNNGAFIWSIANLLRGVYKQADYGKVILPFTILRRLDAVLEPTKDAVLAEYTKRKDQPGLEHILPAVSGQAKGRSEYSELYPVRVRFPRV